LPDATTALSPGLRSAPNPFRGQSSRPFLIEFRDCFCINDLEQPLKNIPPALVCRVAIHPLRKNEGSYVDRNLALDLVRVTEAAALSAATHMGRGDKILADQAGVDGMRRMFDNIDIDGVVVIGEGEMDEAPMLYIGEQLGRRGPGAPQVDIAVDPVEGTTSVAKGLPNAIAVVAMAPRGCL